jgi:hypothetical protein
MKNIKWLFLLLICLGLVITANLSCNRSTPSALRIVSINSGNPLIVDVADWGLEVDWETQETTLTYHFAPDQVIPIDINYNEPGLGLPTYPTNYTARITDYSVQFKVLNHTSWSLSKVSGVTNISIVSDPNATANANLKMLPQEWIAQWFDSLTQGCMIKATVIISGYEELTRNPIADTGYFTINTSDYYDDPLIFGSK